MKNRLGWSKPLKAAVMGGVVAAGLFLTGCADPLKGFKEMPVDVAWTEMEAAKVRYETGGSVLGGLTTGLASSLGASSLQAASQAINEAQSNAERIAKNSTVPFAAIEASADKFSNVIIRQIPETPLVQGSEWRLAMLVGEPKVRSEDSAQSSFLLRDMVVESLNTSGEFSKHFYMLTSEWSDRDKILDEYASDGAYDPEGLSENPYRPHPNDLVVLTTNMELARFMNERDYRIVSNVTAELWSPQMGTSVLNESERTTYLYHPARKEYISQAEDNALRRAYEAQKGN